MKLKVKHEVVHLLHNQFYWGCSITFFWIELLLSLHSVFEWVFVDSHCLGKGTPSVENQTLFLNISSLLWASKYWNLTSTDKKEQPTIISYNTICTVISTVMVWMKMKMKLDVPCLFMSYEVNQAHQLSNFHQSWPKNFWKMILAALPQHLINLKLDITLN